MCFPTRSKNDSFALKKYNVVHFELDHAVQNDAIEMISNDEKWKSNTAFDLEDEEQDIDSCSAARQPIQLFFTWISSLWMFMDVYGL